MRLIIVSNTLPHSYQATSQLSRQGSQRRRRQLSVTGSGLISPTGSDWSQLSLSELQLVDQVPKEKNWQFSERSNHPAMIVYQALKEMPLEHLFVGWPGQGGDCEGELEDSAKASLSQAYWEQFKSVPVWIEPAVARAHYEGVCKSMLWPMLHYLLFLVYIVSGRDQVSLERWLGQVQGLGLSAEHGSFLKPVTEVGETAGWLQLVHDLQWQQQVIPILEHFTERTPGSFIERKVASLCWHYRMADPEFAARQAANAHSHLNNLLANTAAEVEIISGKRNLEIRSLKANKGTIVRQLLERHANVDFILCLGDDRTDEDMFRQLLDHQLHEGSIFCCVVGSATTKTLAQWHLNTPEHVVSLLLRLSQLASQRSAGTTI